MARRVRKPLLAILPIVLVVVLGIVLLPGGTARNPAAGPGCNNPSDSALNQYCDPVPGSTGAHAPRAGQEALAAVLPTQLVNRIRRTGGPAGEARRSLLSLPAPGPRRPLQSKVSAASVETLSESMVIVLVSLAVALGAAAFGRAHAGRGYRGRPRPE